jgi:uncharacterized protein with ParB-like and HNH nuclease domain
MKPYPRSIFDLFDGKRRYEVPLFQRQYVWNRENHWEPLWEDIERKFQQRQNDKATPPHFLGAMVLDQRRVYGNAVPAQLVIDGQQRLTTFQIFLAAFRDVCAAEGQNNYSEECSRYLLNTGIMENDEIERYKLWPTNVDRQQFSDIIDSTSKEELDRRYPHIRKKYQRYPEPRPAMVECYTYFHGQLTDFLHNAENPLPLEQRTAGMHDALRSSLQVVTVELEGDDDAQVIFETLNARGQPLLPSDLLRNYIFLRAVQHNENQQELYERYWLPFDDGLWREEEKQGRLTRPRSDIFLQHYLTLHTRKETLVSHLYGEYKSWINQAKPFPTVEEELKNLERYREHYLSLVRPASDSILAKFSVFLNTFDVSTVLPLVLGVLGADQSDEDLRLILSDLESYIFRRAVCDLGTKNYNRLFLNILIKVADSGFDRESIRSALAEQKGESTLWPSDAQFAKAWLDEPVYQRMGPSRVQYALREIEDCLHQPRNERIAIVSALTVEHVLPDGWIENWPLTSGNPGVTEEEQYDKSRPVGDIEATEKRDRAKHSFGNLTLLTQPLNSSVSNSAFPVKKPEIIGNSALALNRYFLHKDSWDESEIAHRGDELYALAVKRWTHPGQ